MLAGVDGLGSLDARDAEEDARQLHRTWETVQHCTTNNVPRSGVIGRVLDAVLPAKTETHCTTEVRKNYF